MLTGLLVLFIALAFHIGPFSFLDGGVRKVRAASATVDVLFGAGERVATGWRVLLLPWLAYMVLWELHERAYRLVVARYHDIDFTLLSICSTLTSAVLAMGLMIWIFRRLMIAEMGKDVPGPKLWMWLGIIPIVFAFYWGSGNALGYLYSGFLYSLLTMDLGWYGALDAAFWITMVLSVVLLAAGAAASPFVVQALAGREIGLGQAKQGPLKAGLWMLLPLILRATIVALAFMPIQGLDSWIRGSVGVESAWYGIFATGFDIFYVVIGAVMVLWAYGIVVETGQRAWAKVHGG